MLSNLVTRYERSRASNWLTKRARADADSMVEEAFAAEAVALWETRHFQRVSMKRYVAQFRSSTVAMRSLGQSLGTIG